jgi:acetyltransferase-like isoleucine patch superfamily enzyme
MDNYIKDILNKTSFYSSGSNNELQVYKPFHNSERIKIGSNVTFAPFSYISVTDLCVKTTEKEVNAYIENDVRIGPNNRIEVCNFIWIKKSVMFGPNIFLSDATHNYEDVNKPIKKQGMKIGEGVIIEEGAWIGANSVLSGSFRIGRGAVVGANTVLNNTNIPAHSVVSGNPATLIKIYDYENEEWVKVNSISSERLNEILKQRD